MALPHIHFALFASSSSFCNFSASFNLLAKSLALIRSFFGSGYAAASRPAAADAASAAVAFAAASAAACASSWAGVGVVGPSPGFRPGQGVSGGRSPGIGVSGSDHSYLPCRWPRKNSVRYDR